MVFFAIAHRYAFPHTDYIHYLQRHKQSGTPGRGSRRRSNNNQSSLATNEKIANETLFLLDSDNNAVNDGHTVDVEYEPPNVRQLDRPMSVSRALLGVVPHETLSDIARMSYTAVGEGRGSGRGSGVTQGNDIVFSREHAEGI